MTREPTHGFPVGVPAYQPLGLLGQGASGQVFKARQRSTDQFVAIKIPSTPYAHDPAAQRRVHQRLHQETRVLAMLQHAHIVRLIDKGLADGGLLFAVLEFVPGETLRDFLQHNGRLPLPDTLELMAQVLDVLAFLHAHHVVHRDLKPENVMVVPTGTALHAKVLDFGLASHHGEPFFLTGAEGTPAYCAPEQLRGEPCVPATDIYAWALMFVECLTARPCVQGADVAQVLQRQLSPSPIPLPEALLGQPLTTLLRHALQKDLRLRTANAAHLYGELTHCLAQLRGTRATAAMQSPAAGSNSRFGTLKHMTMDALEAASVTDPASFAKTTILCLTLHLRPARDASVALSDLQDIRAQQMQWCANVVQAAQGRSVGILGDCMLFRFEQGPDDLHDLQQATAVAQDLCTQVQRKSRVLEVQHGVCLALSGGMHTATRPSQPDVHGDNHAANVALHLNSLAEPGVVVLSFDAHTKLMGSVPTQTYTSRVYAQPPSYEPVYRLVVATSA